LFIFGHSFLGKPVNEKKEPFTPGMMRLILLKYGDKNDLSKLRVCVLCLLGFSRFLCYNELSIIKTKNIVVHDSHVELTLVQRKTGIY
jgi:hypothetical protein